MDTTIALIIATGLSAGSPGAQDLPGAATDAASVRTMLIENGVADVNIRVVAGERATRGEVLAHADWLGKRASATPGAHTLVFYSGHGAEGASGLCVRDDATTKTVCDLSVRTLRERISERAPGVRTRWVIDACHGAGVTPEDLDGDAAILATGTGLAYETELGGRRQGALSWALGNVLKHRPRASLNELGERAGRLMSALDIPQRPVVIGDEALLAEPMLSTERERVALISRQVDPSTLMGVEHRRVYQIWAPGNIFRGYFMSIAKALNSNWGNQTSWWLWMNSKYMFPAVFSMVPDTSADTSTAPGDYGADVESQDYLNRFTTTSADETDLTGNIWEVRSNPTGSVIGYMTQDGSTIRFFRLSGSGDFIGNGSSTLYFNGITSAPSGPLSLTEAD